MYSYEGYGVKVVREPQGAFERPTISTPDGAFNILQRQLGNEDREIFAVVLLNIRGQVLGINTVAIGSLTSALVHPREVFKPAILMGASAVILAHNHPAGDTSPSHSDIEITRRLDEAGKLLGIQVLDHLIITNHGYNSIKDVKSHP